MVRNSVLLCVVLALVMAEARPRMRTQVEKAIPETKASRSGATLFRLDARSRDEYFQLLGPPNPYVSVERNGNVVNRVPLDYEKLGANIVIQLWVAITSRRTRRDIARQRVIIYIKDVNDEIPVFTNQPQPMQAVVPAHAKANTPIYTLTAVDSDADSDIRYRIVRQEPPGAFDINGFTGEIRTRGWYKFQPGTEFFLIVVAVDVNSGEGNGRMQSTPETNLYISTEEQELRFLQDSYEVTIPDNLPLGSEVISVEARITGRGYFTYSIPNRNGDIPFKISNENRKGVVRVSDKLFLEGRKKTVIIPVQAQDYATNQVATAEVVVTIKRAIDLKPRFILPQYTVPQIKEDTAVNTSIIKVEAIDPVYPETEFTYTCSLQLFRVDQNGIIYVNGPLDADSTRGFYLFHVFARSKENRAVTASAVVQVFVENINDEAPQFDIQTKKRVVEVQEDEVGGGKALLQLTATDGDGDQVKYRLKPSNDTKPFAIDEHLGILRFKNVLLPLEKDEYEVVIIAYDDGSCCERRSVEHTVNTTVKIKIVSLENQAPQFINCRHHRATIRDTARPGDKVMKVFALDPQRDRVLYKIVSYRQSRFSINPDSGQISVFQYLNREADGNKLYLTIRAEKASQPNIAGFCTVVITVTGNSRLKYSPPNHRPHRVMMLEVAENEEIKKGIVKILPNTRRGGRYRDRCANFQIKSGNRGRAFILNRCSGIVSVGGKIDYETRQKYELRIRATDRQDNVLLIINVKNQNDNPPRFTQKQYTVWLNKSDDLPKQLLSPRVTDLDSDASSFIFFTEDRFSGESAVGEALQIDSKTGSIYQIRPFKQNELVREARRLTLFVQDEGGTGLVTSVPVFFKDLHIDAAPHFILPVYNVSIPENGRKGYPVIRVSAANQALVQPGELSTLSYSLVGDEESMLTFKINKKTGKITTIECCLDREKIDGYSFNVTVKNNKGLTDSVQVNVKILDENDVKPKFNQTKYEVFLLKENALTTSLMPLLKVSTNDSDESNRFVYRVTTKTGSIGTKFTMVNNIDGTGTLYQVSPLTIEEIEDNNGEPSIVICVNDKGGDCLEDDHSAFVSVFLVILEKRNKPPYFASSRATVAIPENEKVSNTKWLTQVQATDPDGDVVWYEMKKDEDESIFTVDPEGKVFLLKELDRENQTLHKIKILAIDEGRPQKTATMTMSIKVEDVNDNAPELVTDSPAVIWENEAAGRRIRVRATDNDSRTDGNGGPFQFKLDPSATDEIKNTFRVSQDYSRDSAVISTLKTLDREYTKEYEIPIIITDNGKIAQSATSTLTLTVGDKNDYIMRPYTKNTQVFAYNGALATTEIGRVYALDPDDWDIIDKTYYWKDGQRDRRFSVERNTGQLTVQKKTPPGNYFLKFHVYDRMFGNTVEADVAVDVVHIEEQVLQYVVGIQLQQVTARQFLKPKSMGALRISMRYTFIKTLQNILQRNRREKSSIQILNLKDIERDGPTLQVYFTTRKPGKKTKYYRPDKILTILAKRQKEFERGLGVEMKPLDNICEEDPDCYPCCVNIGVTSPIHNTVDVNETSYVFINMEYKKQCNCEGGADGQPSDKKLVALARRYINDDLGTAYTVSQSEVQDRPNTYLVFLELAEAKNPEDVVQQCQVEIEKPSLQVKSKICKYSEDCGESTRNKCIDPKGDPDVVCSGNGVCDCGECSCSGTQFSGDYCQCDNLSCPKFQGKICGGISRGKCVCGTCECNNRWTGFNCNCTKRVDSCMRRPYDDEPCSGNGDCRCGECVCDAGYTGTFCEKEDCPQTTETCIADDGKKICSGQGTCTCGKCECNVPSNLHDKIYGDFCECDNFSCPKVNGILCSGADQGTCDCGECKCRSHWSGDDCSCNEDPALCTSPGTQEVCSGRGTCACGVCECETGYEGDYCEATGECTDDVTACESGGSYFQKEYCNNRGECVCGKCICNKPGNDQQQIYGDLCECDNFSCEKFNGEFCSGVKNGVCDCGECECKEGWTGSNCNCTESEQSCKQHFYDGYVCSRNGECVCGVCVCDEGYTGDFCDTEACTKDISGCKESLESSVCSDRGICICGKCNCSIDEQPFHKVYGEFCECDNFSCPEFEGEICSGNGECKCKKCECSAGWTGESCNCSTSELSCQNPVTSELCSNQGTCECNACQCDEGYSGIHCDIDGECSNDDSTCYDPNNFDSEICSGKGRCECGICICNEPYNSTYTIKGEFCECDSSSCKWHDGQICSGPDNGICDCGVCNCNDGWSGEACECSTDTYNCDTGTYFTPTTCHNHGECQCGNCACNFGYAGSKCEIYPYCATLEGCVRCSVLDSSASNDCEAWCKNATYKIMENNDEVVDYEQCEVQVDDCDLDFWFHIDTLPLIYKRKRCDEMYPEEAGSGLEDTEDGDDEDYVEKEGKPEDNVYVDNENSTDYSYPEYGEEEVDKEDEDYVYEDNGEDYVYEDNDEDYVYEDNDEDYDYEDNGEYYDYEEDNNESPADTTEGYFWNG